MTAQDFLAWMDAAKARFAADIVRMIGVNRNTAQRWVAAAEAGEDLDIKPTVALAMSAAVAGLQPWGTTERTTDD